MLIDHTPGVGSSSPDKDPGLGSVATTGMGKLQALNIYNLDNNSTTRNRHCKRP